MLDLQGQVGLISGVGSNIGLAIARRLAELGARLAVSDIDPGVADRAATEVRGMALSADIRQASECRGMVQQVIDRLGRLDILVNTAGQSSFAPLLEMTEAAWRREIDTNLTGSFLIGQAAARAMVAAGNGGRIILFGSTAAESARAGAASHSASKAGVQMLVKVMAIELAPHGITVNAVSPGLVPHPGQASGDGYREAFKRLVPLGRLGRPEDVAGAVAYLASDAAAWVTGEVLHVDGGFLAGRPLPPTASRTT